MKQMAYYYCDEKFKLGLRCKKLFMIETCWNEEDGGIVIEDDLDIEDQHEDTLEISLHAISGIRSPETMRVQG
ncbi:hypothetical protein JRO89_XS11G0058600 [Xanthoceras sorbifolium]|uniref:Uncharacterized protein n=1 Tax=Xanthoceras sorbifolium TaxID=99658 RepID=A0ABQ8HEU0_9ROSI|nr:hypothetical protein JRO89_XS11G0058600 [Xanthoceras sorbifolium]